MGTAFPELKKMKQLIENVIKEEEASFLRTLDQGLILLDKLLKRPKAKKFPVKKHSNFMIHMAFLLTYHL